MLKVAALVALCLLAACAGTPPPRSTACIPGDPSGSLQCQAETYKHAP